MLKESSALVVKDFLRSFVVSQNTWTIITNSHRMCIVTINLYYVKYHLYCTICGQISKFINIIHYITDYPPKNQRQYFLCNRQHRLFFTGYCRGNIYLTIAFSWMEHTIHTAIVENLDILRCLISVCITPQCMIEI